MIKGLVGLAMIKKTVKFAHLEEMLVLSKETKTWQ